MGVNNYISIMCFLEVKLQQGQIISMIRIYLLLTVLITPGPGIKIKNSSKVNVHGKFRLLSLESKYLDLKHLAI